MYERWGKWLCRCVCMEDEVSGYVGVYVWKMR